MEKNPNLIVMLTHHDRTVPNAAEVFEACRSSRAQYWGFKEVGLPPDQMKALFSAMRARGKTTVLEVVAYTEAACLRGAAIAAECGCDILMGTVFYDSVNAFCKSANLRYMPFVGTISGRPSVLEGSVEEMIAQAREYLQKGVSGIDLLAYRSVWPAASTVFPGLMRSAGPVPGASPSAALSLSINSVRIFPPRSTPSAPIWKKSPLPYNEPPVQSTEQGVFFSFPGSALPGSGNNQT